VTYAADAITVEGDWLKGIDVDLNAISDTVQTLAVTALFAEGPTRIRNVGTFATRRRIGSRRRRRNCGSSAPRWKN
jgi:5-enolpyruvylshikimate-3-phosphate synthase